MSQETRTDPPPSTVGGVMIRTSASYGITMRVRLPDGRVLEGKVLEAFMRERDRIDELLEDSFTTPTSVAGL